MKRIVALLSATLLGVALLAIPATAQPEHPHALVLHPEVEVIDGVPTLVGFHRCVDLAANRALPHVAHHNTIHTGTAGEMLFDKAGHAVVPLAPLTGWEDCADFEAALPIMLGPPPPPPED